MAPPLHETAFTGTETETREEGGAEEGERLVKGARTVSVPYGTPEFTAAQELEWRGFRQEGYTDKGGDVRHLVEYETYDPRSLIAVDYDPDGKIRGVLRQIYSEAYFTNKVQGTVGFKTLDDFAASGHLWPNWQEIVQAEPHEIIEIGTIFVPPENRHSMLSIGARLYRQTYLDAMSRGITRYLASTDAGLLAFYREHNFFDLHDIGETDPTYMGSPTTPGVGNLTEFADFLRRKNPDFFRKVIEGIFD